MGRFLVFAAILLGPMTVHAECTRSAFAFVIDRSGSMTGQPLESVKAATSAAVDKLGSNDCVAVITFDSSPTTLVAMHPLTDGQAVKAAITRIQAGGGTDILGGLDAGHKALVGQTAARKKHVVLMTDGMSPIAGLQQLAQTMNSEHMTITTIGYGSSVDEQTLKMLSSSASGRYYRVGDPTAFTTVFTRDVDATLAP